ncbi:hypothetical protein [Streptomyces sp. CdTB01]|uniref:hypothetical protein n=1 Tax=Streptomyces sp. CdTB01 TaxID=1725411 RepID=UPI000A4CABA8|nr:hypothetical protein [Streptomyces sp. CdTB01]
MSDIIPLTWHMVLAMAVLAGVFVTFIVLWLTGRLNPNRSHKAPPALPGNRPPRPRGGSRSRPSTRR